MKWMETNLPNRLFILALAGFMDLTSEGKWAISALLPLLSPICKNNVDICITPSL